MSTPFERYKKRLGGNAQTVTEARKKQIMTTNLLSFEYSNSYKKGHMMDRNIPDNNEIAWKDYDFQIKHTLTETEKKIIAKPGTDIEVGSYISYPVNGERDVTVIIRGRILDDEIMPSYRAFVCQDRLRLKGCPYEFPVYGFNSTYSSKGLIDSDQLFTLDSRNKIYVQKNKYTIRLFEHHRNYRIILGDEDTKYRYFITEMDDISYPGMFIISLKIDEKHPNDDGFYAYNKDEIDFSDLNGVNESTPDEELPLTIECDNYYKVGDTIEIKCNKKIIVCEVNDYKMVTLSKKDDKTYTATCEKPGILTIKVQDVNGNSVYKNVIIK